MDEDIQSGVVTSTNDGLGVDNADRFSVYGDKK